MSSNINSLSGSMTATANYTARNPAVGANANDQPISASNTPQTAITFGNTVANTAAGGADECFSQTVSIVASGGTSVVNLKNCTDVLNQTAINFARLKGIQVRLLSTSQDTTYGTSCSQINVGGGAAVFTGFNQSNVSVFNGGFYSNCFGVGTGGIAIPSGSNNITITNLDPVATAGVSIFAYGGST